MGTPDLILRAIISQDEHRFNHSATLKFDGNIRDTTVVVVVLLKKLSSAHFSDATRSHALGYMTNFKALEIVYNASSSLIDVTLFEDRYIISVFLILQINHQVTSRLPTTAMRLNTYNINTHVDSIQFDFYGAPHSNNMEKRSQYVNVVLTGEFMPGVVIGNEHRVRCLPRAR